MAVHTGRGSQEANLTAVADNNAAAIQRLQRTNVTEPRMVNGRMTMTSRPMRAAEAESLVKFQNKVQQRIAKDLAGAAVRAAP